MLDIIEGDILVISNKEYPIKSCAKWTGFGSTGAFRRSARLSASTKRSAISGGMRSAAATYLTGLKATPLDPVSSDLAATVQLDTPAVLLQTFLSDGTDYVHLVVEELKQ